MKESTKTKEQLIKTKIKTKELLMKMTNFTERDLLQYALGGLLYTPAHNKKISEALITEKYSHLHSMAFCLEDAIADGSENEALEQLSITFNDIYEAVNKGIITKEVLPYFFVRVKYPEQMYKVYKFAGKTGLLKGFIFPKFDTRNAKMYLGILADLNRKQKDIIYGMPILESPEIADVRTRVAKLSEIKELTDRQKDMILNIRFGGNDFCSGYGIRRSIDQNVHDIKVISDIISDIVSIFSKDYVVSGPVWEYFEKAGSDDKRWSEGLRNEVRRDILNGLIGKTAIHPTQLPVIDDMLAVSYDDFSDAMGILNWDDKVLAVAKGHAGNRMNEQKVHSNWAVKTLIRASVYGIKEMNGDKESI